ncbi:MAG: hypothetical protein RI894_2588 [Bacteroidota bacterium]
MPFLFALVLASGMLIGFRMNSAFSKRTATAGITSGSSGCGRIDEILRLLDEKYVDKIGDRDSIEELAINAILENLDPHSAFIPARNVQAVNDELEGEFEGVGVEFFLNHDTINIIQAVSGGPSEKAGIHAGDKIVVVNDTAFVGARIKQDKVVHTLRGKKGSRVRIGVIRSGVKGIQTFTVTRDKIPTYSVDASYMMQPQIGYIKLSKFGEKTYDEFMQAAERLNKDGMKSLIIDLRGNGGGYLQQATRILDQFFTEKELLVYTVGRNGDRVDYTSKGHPLLEFGKVVVLIDESSASAAEITAGAFQDHDRATIIGRRSFGKGLVQEQYELGDGSGLRLTVAHYYTPSGRCIQKPYKGKKNYDEDIEDRFKHGEFSSLDSLKQNDTTKYRTDKGHIVYGGGGITPDVFVPIDTLIRNKYYGEIAGLSSEFTYNYFAKNIESLKSQYKTVEDFAAKYAVSDEIVANFVAFAEKNKVKRNPSQLVACSRALKTRMKAYLARQLFGEKGFYYIMNAEDNTVRKALQTLGAK